MFLNINRILLVTLLCLLNLGYLGINLFQIDPSSITIIRLIALTIILILLGMNLGQLKINQSIFVLILISLLSSISSAIALNFLFICLFILAVSSLSKSFLASASCLILGLTVILSILLIQYGIVENSEDVVGLTPELGEELRTRMSFGYRNVNAFSAVVSGFCLLFMFIGKRLLTRCAIAICLSYVFYLYTDSRTMILSTINFIIFMALFVALINNQRLFKIISIVLIGIPPVLSLASGKVLIEFPLIDIILSGRFSFVSNYLAEISWYRFIVGGLEPPTGVTIDNSFVLIVVALGIPLLTYFTYRLFLVVMNCFYSKDYRTYAFLLSFWLYSFSESNMVRPESLICLVFWVIILRFDNKRNLMS